ncbi:hypothetical protein MJO28_007729 [Puccinia striiformis f. sp. tritici]|nr:hypothetical protein MJO28_007729 [Puccinia striiformis f. sp. tritici]
MHQQRENHEGGARIKNSSVIMFQNSDATILDLQPSNARKSTTSGSLPQAMKHLFRGPKYRWIWMPRVTEMECNAYIEVEYEVLPYLDFRPIRCPCPIGCFENRSSPAAHHTSDKHCPPFNQLVKTIASRFMKRANSPLFIMLSLRNLIFGVLFSQILLASVVVSMQPTDLPMMVDYTTAKRRAEVLRLKVNPPMELEPRKPIPHEQEQSLATSRINPTHSQEAQGSRDRFQVKLDPAEAKR